MKLPQGAPGHYVHYAGATRGCLDGRWATPYLSDGIHLRMVPMALLPILTAPDPRLKKKSQPVKVVDAEIRQLMDDMLETMKAAPGIGLAAPQVGVLTRVVVLDIERE